MLWPHLDLPRGVPATLPVSRNGGTPVTFDAAPGPRPGTTALLPPAGAPLGDSEQLTIRLDLTVVRVRDTGAGTETALRTWLEQQGIELLDREGSTLELHFVTGAPPPQVVNNVTNNNITQVITKPVRTMAAATDPSERVGDR